MNKFLFVFLLPFAIGAQSPNCKDQIERLGPYRMHQFQSPKYKNCIIRLSLRDADQSHRNFQFFGNGLFEVHSAIEKKGAKSGAPGARSFFIFPSSGEPQFKDGKIQDSAGLTWLIDNSGNLVNENGCKIKQSAISTWEKEASGFQLQSCPGSLVFDFGFKRGEPPNLVTPSNVITVRDHFGGSCKIKNSDVLSYSKSDRFAHNWKYKNSKDLKMALAKIKGCESLAEDFNPGPRSSVKGSGATQ